MRLLGAIMLFCLLNLQAQNRAEGKLLEIAQQKLTEGKLEEALQHVNQCLISNPILAEAYVVRAGINDKLSKNTEALTDYSIAIDLASQPSEVYLNRGVLAYKLQRFDLAKVDFRKVLSSKATETNTVYFRQSNHEGIDKIFTVQSGIRDLIYNYLGLIETQLAQYETGILFFDSAIVINPRSADYFAHRGLAYLKLGSKEKAVQDFYLALKLDPEHSVSKNNLAVIKRTEGNLIEAEKFLLEAKRDNIKSPNHYSDLALLQMESGRFKEAILNFDTAITLKPNDGELFINRGLAKEKAGNFTSAMQDFDMALQIDPEWPKAWFVQGNNFMRQGKLNQALENYTVAITYDEDYAIAYYNRGIVQYQLGEVKKACADIQTAEKKGMVLDSQMKEKICVK